MDSNVEQAVADLVGDLEKAWNSANGDAFSSRFAEDADFVNIRGDHARGREAIARGHQAIFDGIYKGSVVRYRLAGVREIAPGVLVAQTNATLQAPTGPLVGVHNSLFTIVLVSQKNQWKIAAFHNTLVA